MTKEYLKDLIAHGHEIEFEYKGNWYSITYGDEDTPYEGQISFCEFYKEPTDVDTFDELCEVTRDGVTVLEMWESLIEDESDYFIY